MWNDIVFIGASLGTISAIVCFLTFLYAIISGNNGHYQEAYICLLMIAFSCNYGYIAYIRITMHIDFEKFIYLLSRSDYFPFVYLVVVVITLLTAHKVHDIRQRRKKKNENSSH